MPAEAAQADRAIVYVYRLDTEFNRGGWPEVFVNGERKFGLMGDSYGTVVLIPGAYEILVKGDRWSTNWWPPATRRPLQVESGREYYIRVTPALMPGVVPGPHLFNTSDKSTFTRVELVPKGKALGEIAKTRLSVSQ